MKKLIFSIFTLAFVLAAGVFPAYALSVRIAFSDPSVIAGNEVTVRMKVSALDNNSLGNADIVLSYDPAYLEFIGGDNAQGGAGSISIGSAEAGASVWSYSLKFKSIAPGQTAIKVNTWEIYDQDGKMASLEREGSSKVTITAKAASSNNAELTSLKISPGSLVPDFSPDVTGYSAEVSGSVDKVAVSASTADANAKVLISGNSSLAVGENKISCKVTAEDGKTVKEYIINVTKTEEEMPSEPASESDGLDSIGSNGTSYKVAESFDASLIPEGFEQITYSYKGKDIMAAKAADRELLLIYLIGGDGSGDFFVYDEKNDSWSPYSQISTATKTITVLPPDAGMAIPEGLKESSIVLNGKKVKGWVWESDGEQRYCVVYGMNWNGEKNLYRYDLTEKTIQRFFDDPDLANAPDPELYQQTMAKNEELSKSSSLKGIIIGILAALSAILLVIIIILLRNRGRADERYIYAREYQSIPSSGRSDDFESRRSEMDSRLYSDRSDVYEEDVPLYRSGVNIDAINTAASNTSKANMDSDINRELMQELAKEVSKVESSAADDDDFEIIDL